MLSILWQEERGQDVAEYAMMLIIILLLAGVSVRLIGSNVKQVFAKTIVTDVTPAQGNQQATVLQDCEDAVRQQLDLSLRTDFAGAPSVRRIDDKDFQVESFVQTRSADGSVMRIDYRCSARCNQGESCSVEAELRR